jgi:hypothetical protein
MNTERAEIKGAAEQPKTIDNVSCRLGDDIAERLGADSTVYVSSSGRGAAFAYSLAEGAERGDGNAET